MSSLYEMVGAVELFCARLSRPSGWLSCRVGKAESKLALVRKHRYILRSYLHQKREKIEAQIVPVLWYALNGRLH